MWDRAARIGMWYGESYYFSPCETKSVKQNLHSNNLYKHEILSPAAMP